MNSDQDELVGVAGWLVTFTDLLFLLLSFFVMKLATQPSSLAFSDRDQSATSQALNTSSGENNRYQLQLAENDFRTLTESKLQGRFTTNTNGNTNGVDFGNDLSIRRDAVGLTITVQSPVLDSDPTDLTFRTSEFIRSVASVAHERGLSINLRTTITGPEEEELSAPVISPTLTAERRLTNAAIRQIVDTGFPLSRISATGTISRSTDTKLRYLLEMTLARPRNLNDVMSENPDAARN